MNEVRTDCLTPEEIASYRTEGYLSPIRVLTSNEVSELRAAIDEFLSGKAPSERYELTEPTRIRTISGSMGETLFEYEEDEKIQESDPSTKPTFPFLFNLWKVDERFANIGRHSVIAGMARQLIGCDEVLLMEDNAVIKSPHSKYLPWHQDYSYWPLAEPAAITAWIALDDITEENGAMQVVPRSHELGERLPVMFGSRSSFMGEYRPGVLEVPQDPASKGYEIVTYGLRPGECGFHHPLLWHGSTANVTDQLRVAFILRYVAAGTIWLGATRFPYDDIGCAIGDPLNGNNFPAVKTTF